MAKHKEFVRLRVGWVRVTALALVATLHSGCLVEIHHRTISHGAAGVVLNSVSRAPVPGATVALSWSYTTNLLDALPQIRKPTVKTGPYGNFSIPAKRAWSGIILFGDYFTPSETLVVRRIGYEPTVMPFDRSTRSYDLLLYLTPASN